MYKVFKNGGIARSSRTYLKSLQQRALATSQNKEVITSADVVIIGEFLFELFYFIRLISSLFFVFTWVYIDFIESGLSTLINFFLR